MSVQIESESLVAELAGVRVLVLDDEPLAREAIRNVLELAGCKVETTPGGRDGVHALLERDFDVLTVDLRMDGMDGMTFLREIRSIWPWIGVVVVTGYPADLTTEQARELDVQRVLGKPFAPAALRAAVAEEAREKRKLTARSFGASGDRLQYLLGVLRRLGETAIQGGSLTVALHDFCEEVGGFLPCAVVGMLGLDSLSQSLILIAREAVGKPFLDDLKREILRRYESLGGHELDSETLECRIEGPTVPGEECVGDARSTFVVPIVVAGQLRGMLALATRRDSTFGSDDVSFLYHAANQFSTVLVALERMRELAIRDPVTDSFNRRYLEGELDRLWEEARRYDSELSVALLDIDHFKRLNDEHGHPVGDRVLNEFVRVVEGVVRTSDIVGRFGGDEFAVLLAKAGDRAAVAFARRLLRALRRTVFCADSQSLHLTASIGIASLNSNRPPRTTKDLLEQADFALMDAKRGGRDRFCVWGRELLDDEIDDSVPPDVGPPAPSAEHRVCILVVDDEEAIRGVLKVMLEMEGYSVETCDSVSSAMAALDRRPGAVDIVLTDLGLGDESGLDLLHNLTARSEAPLGIVMTGQATVDNAIGSLRRGAYDFIEKPIARDVLLAIVGRALEYRRVLAENRRYQYFLEDMVREKSMALRQSLDQTRLANEFTLESFVELLDAREHGTAVHSLRVRALAHQLGLELGLPPDALEDLRRGAQLHDVGKIAIPDAILLKSSGLTEAEWTVMRTHSEIGWRIISSNPALSRAAEIVRSHHEHYDGSGYPRGLAGGEICLGGRVFAVIDAYDAMRSERSYKRSRTSAAAREEIVRGSGSQFDPQVVNAFLRCFEKLEAIGAWDSPDTPSTRLKLDVV